MLLIAVIIHLNLKKRFSEQAAPFGPLISLLLATAVSSLIGFGMGSSGWFLADLAFAGGAGLWLYFQPGWPALVAAAGYQVLSWVMFAFVVNMGADPNAILVPALGTLVLSVYTVTGALNYHRLMAAKAGSNG